MRSTAIDRRHLLAGAGAALAAGLAPRAAAALDGSDSLFLAPCRLADGDYAVAVVTERGDILRNIRLPARGHDLAVHPESGRAVAFARRPGTFAVAFDIHDRTAPAVFVAEPDRHFFGHGTFSEDGRLLYATENDFAATRGVIGIYDVGAGFRRIGEFESHGIGPHEAIRVPGSELLAVANGGIETHPDYGRRNLNITTMRPSLALLDLRSGDLVGKHELPQARHQLSIRHLAVDAAGRIWFGSQWEGDPLDTPPLVGCADRDGGLRLTDMAEPEISAMRAYVGAVAASRDGSVIAASAPRGGLIAFWEAASGRYLGASRLADSSGIAGRPTDGFQAGGGGGDWARLGSGGADAVLERLPIAFDNHLRRG